MYLAGGPTLVTVIEEAANEDSVYTTQDTASADADVKT